MQGLPPKTIIVAPVGVLIGTIVGERMSLGIVAAPFRPDNQRGNRRTEPYQVCRRAH
jgi:hypothetical protein